MAKSNPPTIKPDEERIRKKKKKKKEGKEKETYGRIKLTHGKTKSTPLLPSLPAKPNPPKKNSFFLLLLCVL